MLWMTLDGKGPLYLQVYRAIRKAILEGKLAPGAGLPSTRGLAKEIGVSRNTVILAYAHLQAERYIATRRASGVSVASELPDQITSVLRSGAPIARQVRCATHPPLPLCPAHAPCGGPARYRLGVSPAGPALRFQVRRASL
jgi:DNA-binding transcriptional regulator YhcF (GntR family)